MERPTFHWTRHQMESKNWEGFPNKGRHESPKRIPGCYSFKDLCNPKRSSNPKWTSHWGDWFQLPFIFFYEFQHWIFFWIVRLQDPVFLILLNASVLLAKPGNRRAKIGALWGIYFVTHQFRTNHDLKLILQKLCYHSKPQSKIWVNILFKSGGMIIT